MVKQIFVNLPVRDLDKSKAFFGALGFIFNPQFTNEKGACLIIGENIFAMLLVEPFFQSFTKKEIVDTQRSCGVIMAIMLESREAVDAMFTKAVSAGGKEAGEARDHGWMYERAFEDVDGHRWEPFYADPAGPSQ